VTQYYPMGSLDQHLDRWRGRPIEALEALRPLVETVAELHGQGLVHRDIKPHNVFLSDRGLVLGDFGLVFFSGADSSRVSATYENVGESRLDAAVGDGDQGRGCDARVRRIQPRQACCGQWWQGRHILQLWYFRREHSILKRQFPRDERMRVINRLLDGLRGRRATRMLAIRLGDARTDR